MSILYIVRGLPGSGKSTFARKLNCFHIEADMFHIKNDNYIYKKENIKTAHEWCQKAVELTMNTGMDIVVSNTFWSKWENEPYIKFADSFGYNIKIICMIKDYGNIHYVPSESIIKMKERFEKIEGESYI